MSPQPKKKPDLVDRIMAYEMGELDTDATVDLFQDLIDSGDAWKLQGHYGRTAIALIEAGVCQPRHLFKGEKE